MYISLIKSSVRGFKKWSDAHQPHSNDDDRNVANSDAVAMASTGTNGAVMTFSERSHTPWLVPGMGNTL